MGFPMPTFGSPDQMFTLSNNLVTEAGTLVNELTNAANFSPFTVGFPSINVGAAPIPILPAAPHLQNVTWTTPTQPGAFTQTPPDISNLFPGPLTITPPALNFGSPPAAFVGTVPASPALDFNFTYPTVDPIEIPPAPSLLNISVIDFSSPAIPTFQGTVPAFTLVAPTPLTFTEGATYTSSMLTLIENEITSALTTDTDIGLSTSVQAAIFDAAREREYINQAQAFDDLDRLVESMGFALPSGIYTDSRIKISLETQYRLQGLSRDIMIKQAELRLENVTKCRELAVGLESKLIDYANQVQQRAFEYARSYTEALVQIYNAQVTGYTARVEGFKATIAVFDAQIRGIEAGIEVLKSRVSYEQTKAQINELLVQTYKLEIDAQVAALEAAKVQVEIIQTRANVEKIQIDAYAAQIQAFVGTINAYTATVEGYKANVEAQGVIESVYKTQVEAFTAQVQAGTAQATSKIEFFKAQELGYEAQIRGFTAALSAMTEQARSASLFNQAVTEEYKAQVQAQSVYNDVLVKEWQAIITEELQISEMVSKIAEANVQLQISQRQVTEEAIKGAASIMAQLGAAALGAIHWSSNANWSEGQSFNASMSQSQSTSDDHIFTETA